MPQKIFYFDTKNGVTIRDRIGKKFFLNSEAIEHSKVLAQRFRNERIHNEPHLAISVIDESGCEIHREPVYPKLPK
ncbi:MAG: hypothetical protein HY242_01465 [Afipia sp.]|nr:hypothetical protein [Afipia sp.]